MFSTPGGEAGERPGSESAAGGRRLPVSLLDVKLGARMLLKHPLMTLVSVISLAVGIPVGLTPMHGLDALEAPLPVEDGDRVVGLRYWSLETGGSVPATSYDLAVWREAVTTLEGTGAVRIVEQNLDPGTGAGGAVSGAEVTASTFSVLRTAPLLGRTLGPADDQPGAPPVVVLGHDVWRSRFGGDPGVVSRAVRVGGVLHTVVGVMPEGFLFPIHQQMWLPMREQPAGEPGRGAALQVFGRLADGVDPEEAQAQLDVVARRMGAEFPDAYPRVRGEVVPFSIAIQDSPRGGWRSLPGTWAIHAGAILLLVVACANVGLLVFARTAARSAELALRTALGAGRARIVAQVFVEVLVLAVLSTVVGLVLVQVVANRLIATMWSPAWGGLPWWIDLRVTPAMVVDALLLAVFSAAVASIVPALRVTGRRVQESLRQAGATGAGVRLGPLSSALIVLDMAMAVAVVGLVVGVSERMEAIAVRGSAGFPEDRFLSAEITVSDAGPSLGADTAEAAARAARLGAVQRTLVERLRAEPAVRGVAVAGVLPRMDHAWGLVEVQGGAPGDRRGAHEVDIARVDPRFFEGLGQPVLAGRGFNDGDLQGDRRAVIVNRTFVERTLGGRSAVGRQLRYVSLDGEPGPWHEVVGVVPDLGTNLTEPQNGLGLYHPAAPGEIYPVRLAVHVGSDPASFIPRLRELAAGVGPTVIVARAEPLDQVFPEDWYLLAGVRIGWIAFVGILLVLAISGMYTMMALSVAQRTREIGIRTALGARPAHIVATIGGRAAVQVGVGALIGMPLAGWIYYEVQQYTTSVQTAYVVAVVPGIAAMLLIALFACTVPLLRALRIVPTVAMRSEA